MISNRSDDFWIQALTQDIRWKRRFSNYLKALQILDEAYALAQERDLSELAQQGLIQSFEFTHELAWNVFKDCLTDQGIAGLIANELDDLLLLRTVDLSNFEQLSDPELREHIERVGKVFYARQV